MRQNISLLNVRNRPPAAAGLVPLLKERQLHPFPDEPCAYKTRNACLGCRKPGWIQFQDRVAMVLQGRYSQVMPVSFEVVPSLDCNCGCPHCPYRAYGQRGCRGSPPGLMEWEAMRRILDELARHRVGVLWTGGGEPPMCPCLRAGVAYTACRGIPQGIYTNGTLLDSHRFDELSDAKPEFIRFSLNAATSATHAKFFGYPLELEYFSKVQRVLEYAAACRRTGGAPPRVGASVIFDHRNVGELKATAELLLKMAPSGGIDLLLVRPVLNYRRFCCQVGPAVLDTAYEILGPGSEVRERLETAGIAVALGYGLAQWNPCRNYRSFWERGFTTCRASGWFGVVFPRGDVYPCPETAGQPDFCIGNLLEQSLEEIWSGRRRQELIDRVNNDQEFRDAHCPPRCRPGRLNAIFEGIESWRRRGELPRVEKWIDDLRYEYDGAPGLILG